MRAFVDLHRAAHGVEPICRVLQIAPSGYWRHAACQRTPALCSQRAKRDAALVPHVGWRVSSSMHTDFVLDAFEQALYARQPERDELICHSDRGSQYVSIRYTERLAEPGIVTLPRFHVQQTLDVL